MDPRLTLGAKGHKPLICEVSLPLLGQLRPFSLVVVAMVVVVVVVVVVVAVVVVVLVVAVVVVVEW